MKVSTFLRTLLRDPLNYEIIRQNGSHRTLESSSGYPRLLFSGHEGDEMGPIRIKNVLTNQIGLSVDEAIRLLQDGRL